MHPALLPKPELSEDLPDDSQLPDKDGSIVTNAQEVRLHNVLTESLTPKIRERHPDGNFCICCDVGIYFEYTHPVLDGCRAPDWFYVPGVTPMINGRGRRSYVLWKELIKPFLLIEYVSGDGSDERDRTPRRGKFWIYEQAICASYYVIFDPWKATLEAFRLTAGNYVPVPANSFGRFPIEGLGVELGMWEGTYREMTMPWIRVWDAATGKMISLADERIEVAEAAVDETRLLLAEQIEVTEFERKRADEEKQRAERLTAKLRELGIDPDA